MSFLVLQRAALRLLKPRVTQLNQLARLSDHERHMIGNREIVGFGFNGQPSYIDRDDFPFPAIRWQECTPEIAALREKEKGDWNELTCEEKKALYRASFCQTYSEFFRTCEGEWKTVLAQLLYMITGAIWMFYYYKMTIYANTPMPESFNEERRAYQFRRWLDLKANPVRGLASRWDYDKDDWKNPNDSWRTKPSS